MDKKRTAAYCRVSTTSDTQDGSFETQCEYYEKLIREDPGMEFAGVYGDHGKSGRSMHGRKELNLRHPSQESMQRSRKVQEEQSDPQEEDCRQGNSCFL